jgi:hypothetical protein
MHPVVHFQGDRLVAAWSLVVRDLVVLVAHAGAAISIFQAGMLTVLPEVRAWLVQVVT